MARALWLSGAAKSSLNVPPPRGPRNSTVPVTRTQVAIVRQGCRALAMATPRVNLSMIVPLGWVVLMDAKLGTDVVTRDHHT